MLRNWVLAAAALSALAGLVAAPPALADCKMIQVAELPLDANWYGVVADGQINGKPIKVLIDTGASLSMISRSAAVKMGLTIGPIPGLTIYAIGGQRNGYGASVKSLRIGNLVADNRMFAASDGLGDPQIAMILGNDMLAQFDVEFDLPDHVMRLFKPEGCVADQLAYWNKPYSLAPLLATDRDAPSIRTPVSLNGHTISAELDTGAGSSVVDATVAGRVGVVIDTSVTAEPEHGIGQAARSVRIGQFKTFALGEEQISNVRLELIRLVEDMQTTDQQTDTHIAQSINGDVEAMMLIGQDFLHSHRVLVANREHAMVFSYVGGPVFATPAATAKPAAQPAR
jgi:predicted aspartyl protease